MGRPWAGLSGLAGAPRPTGLGGGRFGGRGSRLPWVRRASGLAIGKTRDRPAEGSLAVGEDGAGDVDPDEAEAFDRVGDVVATRLVADGDEQRAVRGLRPDQRAGREVDRAGADDDDVPGRRGARGSAWPDPCPRRPRPRCCRAAGCAASSRSGTTPNSESLDVLPSSSDRSGPTDELEDVRHVGAVRRRRRSG